MIGRPVRLLSIAAVAAIGSMLSAADASAGCMSCGCTPVYSYAYVMPCAAYAPPMYVVNQGPAYTMPVPIAAEPTPAYSYPYVGPTTYYGEEQPYYGYPRWHHRHYASRYNYEGPGYRYDVPGYRPHGVRVFRPHIGPGRLYGDRLHRHGPRFAHMPHPHLGMPHHMQHMRPMHMRGPAPGYVQPMHGPKGPVVKKPLH